MFRIYSSAAEQEDSNPLIVVRQAQVRFLLYPFYLLRLVEDSSEK